MPELTNIPPSIPRVSVTLDLPEVDTLIDLLRFAEVWLREAQAREAAEVGPEDLPPASYLPAADVLRRQLVEWRAEQPPF